MILAGLVGHQRPRELLSRALSRATVPTGYLFAGPAGVGKHLAAVEFSRAWLCREAGAEPCGACPSCALAGGAAHPDLLEVRPEEKSKSISIAQVRELGAWLAQSPALGRRKAAILDPADSLRVEGANALLKTLEEPPPGRVLVLIATHPGALPPTVRSRCQQVSFGALTDEEVAEVLRRNRWPAQAARQAAAIAEGSPGNALERDGRSWQEATDEVRALLEALARGERGAALAFAEAAGEARERTLASLQAIIGFSRLAARERLGGRGAGAGAVPQWLERMETERIGRLLADALEIHRRLEGDRPPNPKLALATLLAGASGPGERR
jgi:DNA polymerase-3 subunit delta'